MTPDNTVESLQIVLQQSLEKILAQYASYVDCIQNIIEEKGISPKRLHTYLLTLPAFGETESTLNLLSDKREFLQKAETIPDIFSFLTTECASFLHYEVFQRIVENFGIMEKKEKKLQYPEYLKAYILKHKISEFVEINPLLTSRSGSKELILKCDIECTSKLARVINLKTVLAKVLGISLLALEIVDVKDGCILITFLIPTFIADVLFMPKTRFSTHQENELRDAAILWLKCNGCTLDFRKEKAEVKYHTGKGYT